MIAGEPLGLHVTLLAPREPGFDPPYVFGRIRMAPALVFDAAAAARGCELEAEAVVRELRDLGGAMLGLARFESATECWSGYDDDDGVPITYWRELRGAEVALAGAVVAAVKAAIRASGTVPRPIRGPADG